MSTAQEISNMDRCQMEELIKNLTLQVEDFEKKKEKEEKRNNETKCPYCQDEVECPVNWNGSSRVEKDVDGLPVYGICIPSQKNPHCLRCARATMTFHKNNKQPSFRCWAKCCDISPFNMNSYGTLPRKLNDVPCPLVYDCMDSHGIGKTDCRLCGKECGGVRNLALHIKNKCPERKVKCSVCKQLIIAKNMEKHNEKCYRYCQLCGPDVKIIRNEEGIYHHICPNKILSTCNFCQKGITISNFDSHRECPKIHSRNLITTHRYPPSQIQVDEVEEDPPAEPTINFDVHNIQSQNDEQNSIWDTIPTMSDICRHFNMPYNSFYSIDELYNFLQSSPQSPHWNTERTDGDNIFREIIASIYNSRYFQSLSNEQKSRIRSLDMLEIIQFIYNGTSMQHW